MAVGSDWEAKASGFVCRAMAQRGITHAQLVERLAALGSNDDERAARAKVEYGRFTAAFFLQCLEALEMRRLVVAAYNENCR